MDEMTGICAGCGNSLGGTLCQPCYARLMRLEPSYQPAERTISLEDDVMTIETQKKKILRHLQTFGSIDPVQALQEYGVFRLAARIEELRQEFEIDTHLVKTINRFGEEVRYARYVLIKMSHLSAPPVS